MAHRPPVDVLRRALQASWSVDTTYASDRYMRRGRPGDPARGQCGPTALVVQDWLGGDLMLAGLSVDGERLGVHYWNRLPDGTEIDLTDGQLLPDEELGAPTVLTRPPGMIPHGAAAYELLASRVRSALANEGLGAP